MKKHAIWSRDDEDEHPSSLRTVMPTIYRQRGGNFVVRVGSLTLMVMQRLRGASSTDRLGWFAGSRVVPPGKSSFMLPGCASAGTCLKLFQRFERHFMSRVGIIAPPSFVVLCLQPMPPFLTVPSLVFTADVFIPRAHALALHGLSAVILSSCHSSPVPVGALQPPGITLVYANHGTAGAQTFLLMMKERQNIIASTTGSS